MARKHIENLTRASLAIVVAGALTMGRIQAGEYHNVEQQNTCSDCHTSHASVRGQTWAPTRHLLKTSIGEVSLCMSCHDGTDAQAPDIVASGTASSPGSIVATPYTSKYGSSAGFFQSDYLVAASPNGHNLALNVAAVAPLSSSYRKTEGMACSDCHDPHGNGNYRNLLPDPNPGNPGAVTIALGTHVSQKTPVNAQVPNAAAAYDTDNVSFAVQSNISKWCADCHDQLSTNATGINPAHFRGHPSDVAIGESGSHTSASNWATPSGQGNTGFGSDVDDTAAGIPRLRFGSQSSSNSIAGIGDTVSCLTCHKAHGSKFKHGMVWPLHKPSPDTLSGCQQCHYK